MPTTSLRPLWHAGQTTLGAWMMLREPLAAEVAALAGYDYVCIDLQHGLATDESLPTMIASIARTSAAPIVRVAENAPWLIGRALDSGATGVIVPMVDTADDARRAVAACRYPPDGDRSIGPITPMNRYGLDYVGAANENVACIPMIETATALDNLDEIVAVPGVDAVYIGPADLSLRLGLSPRYDHATAVFQDALARIVSVCRAHGVIPGVHATPELAGARFEAGFRMITVGYDAAPMFAALRSDLAKARAASTTTGGGA